MPEALHCRRTPVVLTRMVRRVFGAAMPSMFGAQHTAYGHLGMKAAPSALVGDLAAAVQRGLIQV